MSIQRIYLRPRPVIMMALVLVLAVVGYHLNFDSHAGTPTVAVEAEKGSVTSPAILQTDTSASGGSAIKFGAATAAWTPATSTLPWAPPTLASSHRTVYVNDTAATRIISLSAGQDCLIVMPSTPVTDSAGVGTGGDALITVSGGRNVEVIGGHIQAAKAASTTLSVAVPAATTTTFTVKSTAGFPAAGQLRIDGEDVHYTSIDATHFYGLTRNAGYYNGGTSGGVTFGSNTSHAVGAVVYIGEAERSGISFRNQTGTIHVEGLLIDGFVNDGIRVSGGNAILQVERTRIGPNTNYDLTHETDGHPDDLQAYGSGASEIRLAQVTMLTGPNGNGFLNKASDGGTTSTPVPQWRMHDFEIVSPTGQARSLFADSDSGKSAYDLSNVWLRYPAAQKLVVVARDNALAARFNKATYGANQPDIVPLDSVGVGYHSPGYSN